MVAASSQQHQLSEDEILISNLRQLMYNARVSEAELARQTKIPQPTLHKILAGSTTDPRISTLRLLADFFHLSVDDLYTPNIDSSPQTKAQTQSVPIISWSDCIKSSSYLKQLSPANWQDWLVTEPLGENVYGLTSKPSMEPHFPRNTILIINSKLIPTDGDLVVVHYAGTEEATLRELMVDGPSKLLIPLSSNANKDILDENIKILGVLIQSRFSHHNK